MKILFMGTPEFAVGSLEALIEDGYEITAVVTQPDKPKGRSGRLQSPPVKDCALRHGIPVLQPKRIKSPEAVEELKRYPADVYVVAAFGQILSKEILELPRLGCICVHASLLPKYRGASPIQNAIINGETESGVTIMQMDEGIDTGAMLYKKRVEITPEDTFETLHDKLLVLGGEAITEALPLLEKGRLTGECQEALTGCYAPMIEKSMGEIDFGKSAEVIDRQIRGMNPWPSAYTFYNGKQLKLWRAVPVEREMGSFSAGEVLEVTKDYIVAACGSGSIRIEELQLEGKKRMSAHDFLLGVKVQPGECFGRRQEEKK